MANKQVLSVVAASILAAAFTFTGCGTDEKKAPASSSSSVVTSSSSEAPVSSSSSETSTSVSSTSSSEEISSSSEASSSSVATMTSITVSDAYVINATVTVGATTLDIEVGNGVYESAQVLTGAIVVTNGVNDLDGNGELTVGTDVYASTLTAPSGYSNVNPYTTLMDMGMKNLATDFPVAAALAANFDLDVVNGSTIELDREVLIAAKTILLNATANAPALAGGLPNLGEPSSSEASSSSVVASSSSSVNSGLPDLGDDNIIRVSQAEKDRVNAMDTAALTAEFQAIFPVVTEVPTSSSSATGLPELGSSSSQNVSSSSEATSSTASSAGGLPNLG